MVTPGSDPSPSTGGGLPVIQYWLTHTLSPQGLQIWKNLHHKSACLSCAWGTGGQKGGFFNEEGEGLQRCAKSIEAIASELQPKSSFHTQYCLEQLQNLTSQECDRLGRLSQPLIHHQGSNHYVPIGWAEVFDRVAEAFQGTPDRLASYSSGRSSNEAAYLLQLMMRALGSNNLADCSDLCHAASTVGLKNMFGSGTSMVSLEGLQQADCVVLVGSNAPANHPRLMNELIKLRQRGGKVIVVNPLREIGLVKFASPAFPIESLLAGGSAIASLFLQLIPGSDVALFVGIQKSLLEQNYIAWDYLKKYAQGWEAVIEKARFTSWEEITEICGLSQEEITQAAQLIGQSPRVVFAWAMGATQHINGVDNIYSIANTALLTGNAGKLGAGTMPIRGHSNVQGFGSMGVTVRLKEEIRQALEKILQRPLSRVPGYDTRGLIEAADRGQIDALLCLGGNLYGANPDLHQARRALGQISTIVYVATKPNLGHFQGLGREQTLLLPVFARFENPHKTTTESGNNFVRLNDPGETHLKDTDLISEIAFLTELAHRLHGDHPINWRQLQDTSYIRQLIAETIPGYAKIGTIDQTQEEFTIEGRIFTEPHFATIDGKANMFTTPLPKLTLPVATSFDIPATTPSLVLILNTGRSYAQHNTVVYREADPYRGMPHRNCILMNCQDGASMGWELHQKVTVQGDAGKLENVEVIYGDIRKGSGFMFYPEANVLFKAHIDPRSGTPGYKRIPVVVYVS